MWKCASLVLAATVQKSLGLQCDGLEDRIISKNILGQFIIFAVESPRGYVSMTII